MPNPNTFDEASAATEEMFAGEQLSLADVPPTDEGTLSDESEQVAESASAAEMPDETQSTGTEESTQQQKTEQPATIEQAAQTAEVAAQVATEKDVQLQQAMAEIEALKQQNQSLQSTIDEISRENEVDVVEEAMMPPELDINALAFADEETIKQAQAKYASDLAEYNRKQVMKELSPILEQAKAATYEKEKGDVISMLSGIPEFAGIDTMIPQLDKIIKNNKALSSDEIPLDEKYITAFAIAKGVNSLNAPQPQPKELTNEELLEMYNSNPELQAMVEKQRLEQIKHSQQVPPFSASSGAVNAALNIKEKPKTFEEASERTRKMFGL